MSHWTERYLGLGYEKGGRGPHAFDCWGFFRHVQREQFGREVEPVASPDTLREIARTLTDASMSGFGWQRTTAPQTGDGVWMAHFAHPTHVGVYVGEIDGGAVLHCAAGAGSVLQRQAHLDLMQWKITGLYRWQHAGAV